MLKKKKTSIIYFPTTTLILALLITVSCTPTKTSTTVTAFDPTKTEGEVVVEESTSVLMPTFYELSQNSDIVILGQVQSTIGVINTSRNPKDKSMPDPRFFTVTAVYNVKVSEYIVGEGPDTIFLAQWEGDIYHGMTPSPEEIEQARLASKNNKAIALQTNKQYLMFLRSIEVWSDFEIEGLQEGNLFVRTANPWLFDSSDRSRVVVVDTIKGIEKLYPPQSFAGILKLIINPQMEPVTTIYPAPVEIPKYQTESAKSSYPEP